jgi:hypothetical protein
MSCNLSSNFECIFSISWNTLIMKRLCEMGTGWQGGCLGTAVPKWVWDPYTGAKLGLSVEGRKWCFWFGLGFPNGSVWEFMPEGLPLPARARKPVECAACPRLASSCFSETGFQDQTKLTSAQRSSTWEGLSPKLSESSREKEKDKSLRGTRDSRGDSPAKACGIETGGSGSRFDWHPDKPAKSSESSVRYSPDRR